MKILPWNPDENIITEPSLTPPLLSYFCRDRCEFPSSSEPRWEGMYHTYTQALCESCDSHLTFPCVQIEFMSSVTLGPTSIPTLEGEEVRHEKTGL